MEPCARVNRNALGDMEPQKAVWWLPLLLPSPLVLLLLLPQNFNKQIDFKIICRPFWQLMKVHILPVRDGVSMRRTYRLLAENKYHYDCEGVEKEDTVANILVGG